MGNDRHIKEYISSYTEDTLVVNKTSNDAAYTLVECIKKGLKEEVKIATSILLETITPLEIIEKHIIVALDEVGILYENQKLFLPQLIQAAETAKVSFDLIEDKVDIKSKKIDEKEKVILATVHGDIHDIGKNIVKVIMNNYGFQVIDLGKDVPAEMIVETIGKYDIKIVGLSALMTTTVESMKETVKKIKKQYPMVNIIVGGAVLNPELKDYVGAHYYAKDAMETVRIAEKIVSAKKILFKK